MTRSGEVQTAIGRAFFALSMVAFGVQQFLYAGYVQGLTIVPDWMPAHLLWSDFAGVALIAGGIALAFDQLARRATLLLGFGFLACLIVYHGPRLAEIFRDGTERSRAFETLAMCGGAWILAGVLPKAKKFSAWDTLADRLLWPGQLVLALSLVIFGVDHIIFAVFVAGLVPSWIPWHLFWTYFTAFGFIAVAASIVAKRFIWAAGLSLAAMFFLWVIVLHGPRIAQALHNGDEWNSGFVALALSGCGLALACDPDRQREAQIIVLRNTLTEPEF